MERMSTMNPSAGELWLVNLDPTVGDEIKKGAISLAANQGEST